MRVASLRIYLLRHEPWLLHRNRKRCKTHVSFLTCINLETLMSAAAAQCSLACEGPALSCEACRCTLRASAKPQHAQCRWQVPLRQS